MIRISKWSGLVTAASPYIIPPGGATEQINAQSLVPGQLTVRGGMRYVLTDGIEADADGALLEVWGYSTGPAAADMVFGFTDQGTLVVYKDISL